MLHALPYRSTALVIGLAFALAAASAKAQDASSWDPAPHGAARLIGGATHKSNDGTWLRAAIEIRLDPGWHTYWRYPGDSGVPPTFDFSGSENVKSVTMLWPAPQRFPDGAGGQAIGYIDRVVLPLRVAAADPATVSVLHLKLGYAICREICLPAEADLKLALTGKAGTEEPTLVAAEARVPRRVSVGQHASLSIRSVRREEGDGHKRVVVEITAPAQTPVDLFAEGPTPNWALPLPEPIVSATGNPSELRRFTFDLDGLPAGTTVDGSKLTLTAVSPSKAIEVTAPLN